MLFACSSSLPFQTSPPLRRSLISPPKAGLLCWWVRMALTLGNPVSRFPPENTPWPMQQARAVLSNYAGR